MRHAPRWTVALLAAALSLGACRRRSTPALTPIPAPTMRGIPTPEPANRPVVPTPAATPPTPLVTGEGPRPGSPATFAPLVRAVRASVVSVFAAVQELNGMRRGFLRPEERYNLARGTGFLISDNGEILTNNHVIANAAFVEVQLDDGRRYSASVLGHDERLDVALLRVKAPGVTLHPVALGDSDRVEVGDWALAMGNPYGLSQTVTAGIISAVGRTGREVHLGPDNFGNLMQTDASINPGNSGGPLLNLAGEVVGINVAVHREAQGVGFAIPINMAKVVLPQLREYGRVMRSWLGVSVGEVSANTARELHLPDEHGALVMEVEPDSPALTAGIRAGDVIRRFDGHDIVDSTQLPWLASSAGVGHLSHVELLRDGRESALDVTLTAMPELRMPLDRPGMVPIPMPTP